MKGIVHIHNKGVLELGQDLSLIDNGLNTALGYNASLAHLFHREILLGLLSLHAPHLAETTLSDAKVVHKIGLRDSCDKTKRTKRSNKDNSPKRKKVVLHAPKQTLDIARSNSKTLTWQSKGTIGSFDKICVVALFLELFLRSK